MHKKTFLTKVDPKLHKAVKRAAVGEGDQVALNMQEAVEAGLLLFLLVRDRISELKQALELGAREKALLVFAKSVDE